MASYVSQYRGIGQMQPSGYAELLASGGQSIAAGISSFGNSIGDAIKRYQEKKELAGIAEGDLIAKWKADPTIKDRMPDEQKKLAEKVLAGNGNYKDIMSLHAYVDTSYKLEQQRKQDEILGIQKSLLEYQRDNALRAKQTQETLDGALGAALGAQGRSVTSSVPVSAESYLYGDGEADVTDDQLLQMKRMAAANNPTHLSAFVDAVKNGTATPQQRAEVEKYFKISGEQQVGPASSIGDMSKPQNESAVPPEGVRIMAETLGNYSNMPISEGVRATRERLAANIEALKNSPTYASGNRVPIDRNTYIGGMGYGGNVNQNISWTNRYGSGSRSPNVGEVNERLRRTAEADKMEAEKAAKIEAAQRRLSEFNSMTGFQPQPQPSTSAAPAAAPQPPVVERLAAPSAPELSRQVTTQAPATPEDQFSAALKWISENGHKINSDVITQLKDKLNLADVRVVKGDGYDVVMVNGEAKHIDTSGGKRLTPTEAAALEARSIYPESGGGFVGVAPTADEAKKFREMVASDEDTARGIDALLEIANRGGKLNPKDRADAAVISTILKARNRLNIVGPGAVSEADWILLDSAFQNPTQIVTLKDMNKQKLKQTRSQLRSMLESTAKSLGLQPVESLGKGTAVGGKQVLTFSSNGKLVE